MREAEHPRERAAHLHKVREVEHHPADAHDDHAQQPAQRLRQTLEILAQPELFDQQQHTVVQAPEQEVPVRAVPQAGQAPDDENVAHPLPPGNAVAAERDVHIVAKPGGQRDVPPPPELRDRQGDIRVVEVFEEVEAEHPAEADGHVAVAGEVEIDLQRVGDGGQPVHERAVIGGVAAVDDGGHLRDLIGQQQLFGQTHDKAPEALREIVHGHLALPDLLLDGLIAHDGAGDELREEADVHQQVEKVALQGNLAAVEVDDIRQDLKRVKADADRQRDAGVRQAEKRERPEQEAEVFEHDEVAEDDDDRRDQRGLFRARPRLKMHDGKAAAVGHERHEHHEHDHLRLAPGVEDQRRDEQHGVLHGLRADEHAQPRQRQKEKQKCLTAEYHRSVLHHEVVRREKRRAADQEHLRDPVLAQILRQPKRLSHVLLIAAQIDAVDPVKVRSHEFEDGVVIRFAEHQQIPASGRAGVKDDLAGFP